MEDIANIETKHLKITRMDNKDVHKNWKMIQEIPTLPEEVRTHSGTEREKLWNAIQWIDKQNKITQESVKREIRRKEIEDQKNTDKLLNMALNRYKQLEDWEKQAVQQQLMTTSVNDPNKEKRDQADIKYNEFM